MSVLIRNIVKKLLFTAAVLVPVTAYAANPSAVFTDNVVPAGSNGIACGTPVGAAAADIAAIGFNTCAFYSDFTTAIPNTVGTGLPQNWLNCNGDTTPAVWYWGSFPQYGYNNLRDTNPCVSGSGANAGNSQIFQTTDPAGGGTVLEIEALADGSCTDANYFPCSNNMGTADTFGLTAAPNPGQFGFAYFEWAGRTDNPGSTNYAAIAVTEWVTNAEQTRNGANVPAGGDEVELDHLEEGANGWGMGAHIWGCTSPCDGQPSGIGYFPSTNDTGYHTWGLLWVGDGSNTGEICYYRDGVKQANPCWKGTIDNAEQNERHYIGSVNANTVHDGGNSLPTHNYFKYFKVWTCANGVNGSTPSQMCYVSPLP
jgi:hypothetical protein